MKKLMLMLTLIFILFFDEGYCQSGAISITLDKENINIGDVINVNVQLNDVPQIKGFEINLNYDGDYLIPLDRGFIKGELLNKGDFFEAVNEVKDNGKIRYIGTLYGISSIIEGSGNLLSIRFKATKAGTTNLQFSEIKLVQENLNRVDVSVYNKEITINNSRRRNGTKRKSDTIKEINIKGETGDNITIKRKVIHNWDNLDIIPVSDLYEVISSEEDYKILEPLILSIEYSTTEELEEDKLGIFYYSDRGIWVYIGGEVDRGTKTISTKINRLGKYIAAINPYFKTFKDIKGHWSYKYVKFLTGRNIIQGYGDNTFRPDNGITRQEFAKIIASALDLKDKKGVLNFEDEDLIQDWARDYVKIAQGHNILSGYEDGTFRPNKLITRAEMGTALGRLLENREDIRPIDFADKNHIPPWAAEGINKCIDYGIIHGYGDNTIRPNNAVTRAEAAKMIYQLMKVQSSKF